MKKFKVYGSYAVICMVEIEAETMEQAYKIAKNMDAGDFKEVARDDWFIDHAVEKDENL